MLEEKAYGKDLEELRAKLGLNRPIYVQYFEWLGPGRPRATSASRCGRKRPVLEELGAAPARSRLELGVLALVFAIVIAVPIGVLAAMRQDTLADYVARSMAILGPVGPRLLDGHARVVLLPAIWWGWSPPIQFTEFSTDPWAHFAQFLLPAFILGIASAAAHHAPDPRHAARGAAPGLRAHRVGQGAARARRRPQAQPEERA